MKIHLVGIALLLIGCCNCCCATAQADRPLVLAHRGASGYLPEHTLVGVAMAHAMGADYIEQDVVLTYDAVPIVLHDLTLEATTNVAEVFPDRQADDGHWYAADFTLAEIKRLRVNERREKKTGQPRYSGRFPIGADLPFRVPTLVEEIELIQGLNRSTGRDVGITVEIKDPKAHREHDYQTEGVDQSAIVLEVLAQYGYTEPDSKIILQCFDGEELKRIRFELKTKVHLCQPMGKDDHPDMAEVATYAQSVCPSLTRVFDARGEPTDLVSRAHAAGLKLFAYTVRQDALPGFAPDTKSLLMKIQAAGVDGYFTDFPDQRPAQ